MAVDKKSQHVGNHGGAYTDIDGMTKQFTYVDHDRNTTRLKSWKSKEYKPQEPTPEDLLIRDIELSGMNADKTFIEAFDQRLATKYGFERFRKGSPVQNMHLRRDDLNWYLELETIYQIALQYQKTKLKQFINKNYGLQKHTDSENP